MRAIIATDGSASVTAGSTRCVNEPAPPTGSQLSHNENTTIRTRPVQKIGIDSPKSEPSRASPSNSEWGHTLFDRLARLGSLLRPSMPIFLTDPQSTHLNSSHVRISHGDCCFAE